MKKSLVLYCDILGFKELVSRNDKQTVLNHIKKALNTSVGLIEGMKKEFEKTENPEIYPKIDYKLFSDNLYISIAVENEEAFDFAFVVTIVLSRLFQEAMLMHNYLVRGAIVYDEDYYDDKIIFSPALVKAYELESKKANYPRILVDRELIDNLKGILLPPHLEHLFNKSLIIDWSKTIFLNPVGTLKQFFNGEPEERKIDQLKLYYETHKQLTNEYDQNMKANKLKEAEKVLWLKTVLEWLISMDISPEDPANALGLDFVRFVSD